MKRSYKFADEFKAVLMEGFNLIAVPFWWENEAR
jgi:hypothetical protein